MQDYPTELNLSVWNPEGEGKKAMDKEMDEELEKEKKKEEDASA